MRPVATWEKSLPRTKLMAMGLRKLPPRARSSAPISAEDWSWRSSRWWKRQSSPVVLWRSMRQRRPSANWKLQRDFELCVFVVVWDFLRFMCARFVFEFPTSREGGAASDLGALIGVFASRKAKGKRTGLKARHYNCGASSCDYTCMLNRRLGYCWVIIRISCGFLGV